MRPTVAITGALLITAATLTACGGGSGVPELDAVADTWEQSGPQLRKDVCSGLAEGGILSKGEAYTLLADETLEQYPDTFLDDDVIGASIWFLNVTVEGEYPNFWFLDRGAYASTRFLEEAQDTIDERVAESETDGSELPDNFPTNADEYVSEYLTEEEGVEKYLGSLDNWPDVCADADSDD